MAPWFPGFEIGSRREFLRIGFSGLMGMSLSAYLKSRAMASDTQAAARHVILIWLGGGPATIDMWDLKPDAPEQIRGEFRPIDTSAAGVQICEHLPRLATIMDRCLLIRSLSHSIPAHGPGTQYMMTGHVPSPAVDYPSMGSLAAHLHQTHATAVPPYITFGNPGSSGAGYLGSAWNPFQLDDESSRMPAGVSLPEGADPAQFEGRLSLRNQFDGRLAALDSDPVAQTLDRFHHQAVDILRSDSIRRAFALDEEPHALQEQYGRRSGFGQNALRARRLIEAGARFVTVGTTGWDTHSNNFTTLRTARLPQLDQGLAALINDLHDKGLLEETLVCCCGEFGRTPTVNTNSGRDHWARAMSVLLAGGGLKPGTVYGATDDLGGEPSDSPCHPADLCATLLHQIGIAPESTLRTPTGRPLPVLRNGHVLHELLG